MFINSLVAKIDGIQILDKLPNAIKSSPVELKNTAKERIM